MRTATAVVILLIIAAQPACASEAFIAQVTGKAVAAEQAAAASAKTMSAALLALPVKLTAANAFNLPNPPAAMPGTNTALVSQTGTNNFAAVTQTGGGNASVIVQRGSGNQVIVTQRH
jgi:curlin associated repeat protein